MLSLPEKRASSAASDTAAEFDPQTLAQVPRYSTEELSRVEKALAKEFKSLGRQYIEARLARIHKLIDKTTRLIKVAACNDKNWLKIYNFEIETINNIKSNTEDLILMNSGVIRNKYDLLKSVDEYEEELKEIFKNLQSPLAFDETLKELEKPVGETTLPFSYLFQNVFQPHIQNLRSIINEKDYQSRMLGHNSRGNSAIIWKQYYHNLVRRKQELIEQTCSELNALHKEYNHINQNQVNHTQWKNYYNSVVSINDFKRDSEPINTINTHNIGTLLSHSSDPNYTNLDNQYVLNNKIESTVTKMNIIHNLNHFNHAQNRQNEANSRKRIKLNSCLGLTGDEIDSDLLALRLALPKKSAPSSPKKEEIIAEEGPETEKIFYKGTEVDVIDDYSDDDMEEEVLELEEDLESEDVSEHEDLQSEPSEPETIEEKAMKLKYRKLLEINTSPKDSSPFPASFTPALFFQSLPPIEKFPIG